MKTILISLSIILICTTHAIGAPSVFPTGLTVNQPSKVCPGYTLYSLTNDYNKVVVLNSEGEEVHSWSIPEITFLAKPLSNGRILVSVHDINIKRDALREYDWEGNILWQYNIPSFLSRLHHDFQRTNIGNTLILGTIARLDPKILNKELEDDTIIEIDSKGNIVWKWSTLDHFNQLEFSQDEIDAILEWPNTNVFHTNSIQILPPSNSNRLDERFKIGNIIVSQRNTNRVFVINKETRNVVWVLKNKTIGQHHASMIPRGLHGNGNIILFDNGGRGGFPSQWRFFSKIIELNPITNQSSWEYSSHKSDNKPLINFFSTYRSSVQRLPNGNTLIMESDWGRIFEVTDSGELVWEYVNPYFSDVPGGGGGNTNRIYRAYRVPLTWPTGAIDHFVW